MNFIRKKLRRIYSELDRVDLAIISSYGVDDEKDWRFERLYEYRCRLRRGMYQMLDRLDASRRDKKPADPGENDSGFPA